MKTFVGLGIFAALFLGSSYFSELYADQLAEIIGGAGVSAMVAFVLLTFASEVFAPLTTFPFLPIAVTVWGPWLATILGTIGWTSGNIVAFLLARRFGRPLLRYLVDLKQVDRLSQYIPQHHQFVSILLLRTIMPSDIVSYFLGLVGTVPLAIFAPATLLGIAISASIFANAATLPPGTRVVFLLIVGLIVLLGVRRQLARRSGQS